VIFYKTIQTAPCPSDTVRKKDAMAGLWPRVIRRKEEPLITFPDPNRVGRHDGIFTYFDKY
jgi:hypothetical protein